jgi:hypothetical protein
MFAMVASRALAPRSKLSVTNSLAEEVILPGRIPSPCPLVPRVSMPLVPYRPQPFFIIAVALGQGILVARCFT